MNAIDIFFAFEASGKYKIKKIKDNFVVFAKKDKPTFPDKILGKTWEPIGLILKEIVDNSAVIIKLLPDAYQKHGLILSTICNRDTQNPSLIASNIQELSDLGIMVLRNLIH